MTEIETHEKQLKVRGLLSIVLFAIFFAIGVGVAITKNPDLKYLVVIPLVASYIALPRKIVLPEMNDAQREFFQKVQLWFSYLRVAYFLVALFLLFAVPRFV